MWGKRRQGNRSGHQRYTLLNVDLPAEKVRQQRLRWAVRTAGFVLGAVALFVGVWHGGGYLLKSGFYQNDHFSVRSVDIRTEGVIQSSQIQAWARVQKGDNLFGLDLQRVKRDLEMVPLIETAAVDRVLPETLRLRITERRPLAQVIGYKQQGDGTLRRVRYWIDGHGVVIPPIDPKLTTTDAPPKWMPLIVGLSQAELMPGRGIDSPQLSAALELIRQFDLSPMAGLAHLRQIDVSRRETMEVVTWQGGRMTLALHGLDRQLSRWRQIHDLGRQYQRAIATADLSIKNNLPVKWALASRTRIE